MRDREVRLEGMILRLLALVGEEIEEYRARERHAFHSEEKAEHREKVRVLTEEAMAARALLEAPTEDEEAWYKDLMLHGRAVTLGGRHIPLTDLLKAPSKD